MIAKLKIFNFSSIARHQFRHATADLQKKSDITSIAALTPKQLAAKVAKDVSVCANSDIELWCSFTTACRTCSPHFLRLDLIKVVEAVDHFYRNLDFRIRPKDIPMISELIQRLTEYSGGYTYRQLAGACTTVSHLAANTPQLFQVAIEMMGCFSAHFVVRIAEADADVIALAAVAYSKLGLCDETLFDTLSQYIVSSNDVDFGHVKTVMAACALVGYKNNSLMNFVINKYLENEQALLPNDMAILVFCLARLRSDDNIAHNVARDLIQRHLDSVAKDPYIDAATLACNLLDIDIVVPKAILCRVHIRDCDGQTLFKLAPILLPENVSDFIVKIKGLQGSNSSHVLSTKYGVHALQHLTRCTFNRASSEFCKWLVTGMESLNAQEYTDLAVALSKLPPSWFLHAKLPQCHEEEPIYSPAVTILEAALWYSKNSAEALNEDVIVALESWIQSGYGPRTPHVACAEIKAITHWQTNVLLGKLALIFIKNDVGVIAMNSGDVLQTEEGTEYSLEVLGLAAYCKVFGVKLALLNPTLWRECNVDYAKLKYLKTLCNGGYI